MTPGEHATAAPCWEWVPGMINENGGCVQRVEIEDCGFGPETYVTLYGETDGELAAYVAPPDLDNDGTKGHVLGLLRRLLNDPNAYAGVQQFNGTVLWFFYYHPMPTDSYFPKRKLLQTAEGTLVAQPTEALLLAAVLHAISKRQESGA